jgi:hypothetical protein
VNRERASELDGAFAAGRVSTGLMHATPGEMKSLRSSAERMADILVFVCLPARRVAFLKIVILPSLIFPCSEYIVKIGYRVGEKKSLLRRCCA